MTCTQANEVDQTLVEWLYSSSELINLFGARVCRQESNAVTFRDELRSSRHLYIDLAGGRVRQEGNVHLGCQS